MFEYIDIIYLICDVGPSEPKRRPKRCTDHQIWLKYTLAPLLMLRFDQSHPTFKKHYPKLPKRRNLPTLAVHHLASIHFGLYYALAILDTLHSLAGFWIFNTYRGWNSLQAGPQTLLQRRRRGGRLPWTVHVWSCFMGQQQPGPCLETGVNGLVLKGNNYRKTPYFMAKTHGFL